MNNCAGLYKKSSVKPCICHLTDSDFNQAMSAIGVGNPEAPQKKGSRKAQKTISPGAETAQAEPPHNADSHTKSPQNDTLEGEAPKTQEDAEDQAGNMEDMEKQIPDISGWTDKRKPPRFLNLQLTLRLLTTVCNLQVRSQPILCSFQHSFSQSKSWCALLKAGSC